MKSKQGLFFTGQTIPVIDHSKTGATMRRLRKDAGLSLRDVARRMGISAPYLSDLELGRRYWTVEKARDFIMNALGREA